MRLYLTEILILRQQEFHPAAKKSKGHHRPYFDTPMKPILLILAVLLLIPLVAVRARRLPSSSP